MVGRGFWRAEEIQRALRRISANAGPASGQGNHGSAARALGDAPSTVGRRSRIAARCGMESGVCGVPRMGLAPGLRKLAALRETGDAHADAARVVGLRRDAWIASLGSRPHLMNRKPGLPGPAERVTFGAHIRSL